MKIFGFGLMSLLVVIAVGYMLGTLYPGFGKSVAAKVGL